MKATSALSPSGGLATRPAVGGARPSQMMFTYGVGAQIDLPNMSVVVAGLDAWDKPREHVVIKRLLEAVQLRLGSQVAYLAALPWAPEVKGHGIDASRFVGVPVLPFPRWMRCTRCNLLSTCDGGHFRLDDNRYRPQRTRYVHATCLKNEKLKSKPTVVPARFVLACERGHLDDFPWSEFVHGFAPCPKGEQERSLEMYDVGSGMRSTDVIVKCTRCDTSASMSSIYTRSESRKRMLPRCRARHVHLRTYDPKGCGVRPSPMLLGASNMWFPETRTALALPSTESDLVERRVDELWGYLASIPQRVVFDYVVADKPELAPLHELSADAVWAAIERRRVAGDEAPGAPADLKRPEWERFIDPGGTAPSEEFDVRERPVPDTYARVIASVTAATRLRSVVALVGFARIEAPDSGVAEDAGSPRDQPPLAESGPYWVPAAEMRGEGLFIRLPEALVDNWSERAARSERVARILAGPAAAATGKTPRFLLLHSLSHLIINGVALDCGYSAASIRERIYSSDGSSGEEPMAGILLYTAAPDAEGTLGGLVSLAEPERLGRILHQALRRATVCGSDPMCADHIPSEHDPSRHGAACHACLFLPETSCECGNRFLDRSVLEPTLAEAGIAYFDAL